MITAYLYDNGKPVCGGPLESTEGESCSLKKYPKTKRKLSKPVLLIGTDKGKPESIELKPTTWKSGREGYIAREKTKYGFLRVNMTKFKSGKNGHSYGLDVCLQADKEEPTEPPKAWAKYAGVENGRR